MADTGLASLLSAIDNTGPLKGIGQSIGIANQPTVDEQQADRMEQNANMFQQNTPATAIVKGLLLGGADRKRTKAETARDERLARYQEQIDYQAQVAAHQQEVGQTLQKYALAEQVAKQNGTQIANALSGLELGDQTGIKSVFAAVPEVTAIFTQGEPEGTTVDGGNIVDRNGVKMFMAYGRRPDGTQFQSDPLPVDGILQNFAPEEFAARNAGQLAAAQEQAKLRLTEAQIDSETAQAGKYNAEANAKTNPQARPLSATEQKEYFEAEDLANAATGVLGSITDALAANNKAFSGYTANTRAAANRLPLVNRLIPDEGANATTELNNIITGQALESLKTTFGAAPTEGERKILLDMQASVDKTPQEREIILNRAAKAAERRLQTAQGRMQALASGQQYSGGNQSMPAQQVVNELPQGATQIGTSGGKPVFRTPDGKTFLGQ